MIKYSPWGPLAIVFISRSYLVTCPSRASIKGHFHNHCNNNGQRIEIHVCKNEPSSRSFFAIVMAPWAFKTVKFLGIAALVWFGIFTALPGPIVDARSTAAMVSEQSAHKLKSMSTVDTDVLLQVFRVHARELLYCTTYGRVPCARDRDREGEVRYRVQNRNQRQGLGKGRGRGWSMGI